MIDASVGTAPAQDAVSEYELHALRLAIDATVERIKRLEDCHRHASRLFGLHPLIAQQLPTLQARGCSRIVCEPKNRWWRSLHGIIPRLLARARIRWVDPPVFQ